MDKLTHNDKNNTKGQYPWGETSVVAETKQNYVINILFLLVVHSPGDEVYMLSGKGQAYTQKHKNNAGGQCPWGGTSVPENNEL